MAGERMTMDTVALAETVTARVCHDLAGLAGTLMNTLEMAQEDAGSEALGIAAEAGQMLGGRLRLLRAAWGGVGGARGTAAMEELLAFAAGYPRIRTDWSGCTGGPFAPALARLLLNVALTGIEAARRAGTVRFSGPADGIVTAMLDGPNAAWPAVLTAANAPNAGDRTEPREVQPVLTALFARVDGIGLVWDPATPGTLVVQP